MKATTRRLLGRWLLSGALVLLAALPAAAQDVRIAAASDLQAALPELVARFERATQLQVQVVYGSSGTLSTQIQNGAPYDVLLSADIEYARQIASARLADPAAVVPYATGSLVIWARKDSAIDLTRGVKGLSDARVRRIAIGNPDHAPYGRAAAAALRHAGIYDAVRHRLVLGDNIAQATQFAQSGNADVAMTALALALGPVLRSSGRYVEVPTEFYPPIVQGAVWMKAAKNVDAARRFVTFLTQPSTSSYLQTAGFKPVAR